MINLTIDIGNSSAKAALFEGGRLVEVICGEDILRGLPAVDRAILVSTGGASEAIEEEARARSRFFVKFDHSTPVPLENLYATPETLGPDRLAAAVGAHSMIRSGAVGAVEAALVVDFGTAITCDIVTARGEYLGGNISPGAGSRFRALHDYTVALPLGALPETVSFPARDTKSAIESGVVTGIVAETERYITLSGEKFGTVGVIFTGGDADFFAGRVNFPIFAVSELVFRGLNAILEHNANL
jgi:type III pantothenate kinase